MFQELKMNYTIIVKNYNLIIVNLLPWKLKLNVVRLESYVITIY